LYNLYLFTFSLSFVAPGLSTTISFKEDDRFRRLGFSKKYYYAIL